MYILRVLSFGVIQIRISDPRSLRSWYITGTDEFTLTVTDSLASLINRDLSDLRSLILIQITPKECTLIKIPATLKHEILNLSQVDTSPVDPLFAPTVSAYKRPLSVLKLGQEILPYKQVFALAPILAGPAEGKKLLNHKYRNDCQ